MLGLVKHCTPYHPLWQFAKLTDAWLSFLDMHETCTRLKNGRATMI